MQWAGVNWNVYGKKISNDGRLNTLNKQQQIPRKQSIFFFL